MKRMVICKKYQAELEGLIKAPLPGALGQDIFETVSAKAWAEWQEVQTMIINERHLNLIDPEARKFLTEQMKKFLNNDDYEKPAGYVPPE